MGFEWQAVLSGWLLGLPVSVLFFWGLARGMDRALASPRPGQWLLLSFLLRAGLLLATAWLLMRWLDPLAGLIGLMLAFMSARVVSVRLVQGGRARASDPR